MKNVQRKSGKRNMWDPEVTEVLPASELNRKGRFFVASRTHMKGPDSEMDAASSARSDA